MLHQWTGPFDIKTAMQWPDFWSRLLQPVGVDTGERVTRYVQKEVVDRTEVSHWSSFTKALLHAFRLAFFATHFQNGEGNTMIDCIWEIKCPDSQRLRLEAVQEASPIRSTIWQKFVSFNKSIRICICEHKTATCTCVCSIKITCHYLTPLMGVLNTGDINTVFPTLAQPLWTCWKTWYVARRVFQKST